MDARILGDYQITKQIGQGSLGKVYLAEHRYMKKQYMLKILPEELSSDRGFIQRFEAEVSLLAALEHPHILKIHNVSSAQGLYFIVSDCVVDEMGETTNLVQYLSTKEEALNEEEIFNILHQVADALDYAHHLQVGAMRAVHQGLKLNNILVGKGTDGINLSLCDFGLTHIVGVGLMLTRTYKVVAEALGIAQPGVGYLSEQDRYPVSTGDSQKLSSLHQSFLQNYLFLAPEQKQTETVTTIDFKSDNFAFGVLAYNLLMGQYPDGYFPMPSEKKDLRWQWDHLIKSCLHTNPAERPESLLPLLEAVKTGTATVEQPTPEKMQVKAVASAPQPVIAAVAAETSSATETNLKPVLGESELERPVVDPDPAAVFRVDSTVKQYHPEPKETKDSQPILTEMKVLSGSSFMRGSDDGNRDEMPRHQVTVDSFAIDVHPVTNEQFVRFLEVMGGEKDANHSDLIRLKDSRIKRSSGKLSIESGYAKHPVVGVTWYGSAAYAKWIGKRLPTEAEWEIAARGNSDHAIYPTGEEIEKNQANFFSSDTTAVKSYVPNAYGLYDMGGNVYEWVADWYGYNYYEASQQEPDDPRGPLQGVYRVLRGGCWKSLKDDLRCAKRHRNNPGTVNSTYGFRCASHVQ